MSKLQTIEYEKFCESLSNPTHLTLFKAKPLLGISLLEIPPRLGLTIVDRLLGGPAHSVDIGRDLSEIELALLEQALDLILTEWCNQWEDIQEVRPQILGFETNGRFLQTSPHDTVMLVIAMEARIGDCLETIQFAFPHYTIEPLVREICKNLKDQEMLDKGSSNGELKWNNRLDNVFVNLTAEWEGLEMTTRQISKLALGDILEFGSDCAQQVQVKIAQKTKFKGSLGTKGRNWAVQLREIVRIEED